MVLVVHQIVLAAGLFFSVGDALLTKPWLTIEPPCYSSNLPTSRFSYLANISSVSRPAVLLNYALYLHIHPPRQHFTYTPFYSICFRIRDVSSPSSRSLSNKSLRASPGWLSCASAYRRRYCVAVLTPLPESWSLRYQPSFNEARGPEITCARPEGMAGP